MMLCFYVIVFCVLMLFLYVSTDTLYTYIEPEILNRDSSIDLKITLVPSVPTPSQSTVPAIPCASYLHMHTNSHI